ncbi:MAG: peroxidase family protein [Myxococcota bacterium]
MRFVPWLPSVLVLAGGCTLPERPNGPSPQGIDDDADRRRDDARGRRGGDAPEVDGREVRTFDGSANNLANPDWGATFAHLSRLAPADYADGRSAMAGPDRPSARAVSNAVAHQGEDVDDPNPFGASDFVWQWGQFIDHDVGLTDGIAESAPIVVPTGDAWFDPTGTGAQLIPFNRALFDPATGSTSPREQENEITAWIDASMVYGSSEARADALRVSPTSPLLATSEGDRLPFNTAGLTNANGFVTDPADLFLAGDVRANEQVGLATLHTLFVREHNRLVRQLQDDRPDADGESIYQQARRLVAAEIQIITYQEFLPALIGPGALPAYRGYDASVHPGLFNAFSVAAFRLGHSMVNAELRRIDRRGRTISAGDLDLREAFFTAPSVLRDEDDVEPILRGLASQRHQRLDIRVVAPLRNFLFGEPGSGGLDLVALNVQRGRDHGVPSYVAVREAMGLGSATSFADITSDAGLQQALAAVYGEVGEVDLWVGGLAEDPLTAQGSQVGPLFRALLVKQFAALRDGDRFWHEVDLEPDELDRVQGTTLARVIRRNTDIDDELADDVFHVP